VTQDYSQAMTWCRKAADKDEPIAFSAIGGLYSDGNGVPQDYSEALRWYHKAADKGYDRALLAIAVMYEQGEGVPQDNGEAYFWYSLSCAAPVPGDTLDKWRRWRDEAAAKLTPAKLAEIQERTRQWVKTHPAIHD
jgi:TPR repeat protein